MGPTLGFPTKTKTMLVWCDIHKMTSIFIQYDTDTINIVGRGWRNNSFKVLIITMIKCD